MTHSFTQCNLISYYLDENQFQLIVIIVTILFIILIINRFFQYIKELFVSLEIFVTNSKIIDQEVYFFHVISMPRYPGLPSFQAVFSHLNSLRLILTGLVGILTLIMGHCSCSLYYKVLFLSNGSLILYFFCILLIYQSDLLLYLFYD